MKTLTALILWVLSSFVGAGPACELVFAEQPEMCAAPPPPETPAQPEAAFDPALADRSLGNQDGARISNGF